MLTTTRTPRRTPPVREAYYAGIEKANNGFIVRYNSEPDSIGNAYEEVVVIEHKNIAFKGPTPSTLEGEARDLLELRAFEELIWVLGAHFNIPTAKNRKYYLDIKLMKRGSGKAGDVQIEEKQ
jgi:hypothetical protein